MFYLARGPLNWELWPVSFGYTSRLGPLLALRTIPLPFCILRCAISRHDFCPALFLCQRWVAQMAAPCYHVKSCVQFLFPAFCIISAVQSRWDLLQPLFLCMYSLRLNLALQHILIADAVEVSWNPLYHLWSFLRETLQLLPHELCTSWHSFVSGNCTCEIKYCSHLLFPNLCRLFGSLPPFGQCILCSILSDFFFHTICSQTAVLRSLLPNPYFFFFLWGFSLACAV